MVRAARKGGNPGTTSAPGTGSAPTVSDGCAQCITRGAHPFARPELDIGALDPNKRINSLSVVFKLTPAQLQDRDTLLAAQLDAGSPQYHQWLTPAQYASRFGANPADIARTATWLSQQGLEVHETSPLGTRLSCSEAGGQSPIGLPRTPMRQYKVAYFETHPLRDGVGPLHPRRPVGNGPRGFDNTHDFYPRPKIHIACRPGPHPRMGRHQRDRAAGLVIHLQRGPSLHDRHRRKANRWYGRHHRGRRHCADRAERHRGVSLDVHGLPTKAVTMTVVPGTGAATPGSGAGIEAVLDVEWSGGIAKGATVNYVFTGADDGNVDDATYYAIDQNLAPVLSESWGGCEDGIPASEADLAGIYASAANLVGMTYVASTGDSGAASCIPNGISGLYVNMPSSFPGVTAVGGTEFPKTSLTYSGGTATGYSASEAVWNESNNPKNGVGAGGGGISSVFARPTYQSGIPTCSIVGSLPTSATASTMRQTPDVAFTAASGSNPIFVECTGDSSTMDCSATGGAPQIIPLGGTSASTPAFAGVVALVNQVAKGRLGNINPLLYALNTSAPASFHDIATGNNEVQCAISDTGCGSGGLYGYAAAAGYDCATGLGSLDVDNLVTGWAALAPTSTKLAATPSMTTEGTKVNLSATIDVTGSSTKALAGLVTFAFESYSPDGTLDLSWVLGATAISGGSKTGGTAVLTTTVPPGFINASAQYVDVVAMYGGDAHHLASTSAKTRITFSTINFAIVPPTASVAVKGTLQFSAMGGIAPVKWYTGADSTCDSMGNCSTLNEATGAFTAGPQAGYVVVFALDKDSAEALADVTVGNPTTAPPLGRRRAARSVDTGQRFRPMRG